MTNQELKSEIGAITLAERKLSHRLLVLLRLAEKQSAYLEDGYPSLFDWLVKCFGYSASAAYRRICAARALQALPDAEEKIISGKVNLTTLSQVQTALQREEKKLKTRISAEAKTDLLLSIQGKSSEETQKILVRAFPETANREESLRWINNRESKLTVIVSQATRVHLTEARDRLSHSAPNASFGEVITVLAENFVSGDKPNHKFRSNTVPGSLKKLVFERAGHRCEFVHRENGKRCESTYQLELDHIRPKALGGSDEFENLRCLCKRHNLFMAERNLGPSQERFRRGELHS